MKFLALALALSLAVGSQAAAMQNDSPSPLSHLQANVNVFLTALKESAKRIVNELDDNEYGAMKPHMVQRLDELHTAIMSSVTRFTTMSDGFMSIVSTSTSPIREAIREDYNTMRTDLEPQRVKLMEVVNRHLTQYKSKLEPLVAEYQPKITEEMKILLTKLSSIMEELQTIVPGNVEETKTALMPIVKAVWAKVSERFAELRSSLQSTIEEYRDHFQAVVAKAKTMNAEEIDKLREKINPLVLQIEKNIEEIFRTITATFS